MRTEKLHIFITKGDLILEYEQAALETITEALADGSLMDQTTLKVDDSCEGSGGYLDLGLAIKIPQADDYNYCYSAQELYEEIKLGTEWEFHLESKGLVEAPARRSSGSLIRRGESMTS